MVQIQAAETMSEIADIIEKEINGRTDELRQLSLKMWEHPELAYEEKQTHDLFVEYLQKQPGWTVTPHAHDLDTAFRAEFTYSPNGNSSTARGSIPVVGFQSELDALPKIGHACGHNLIAIAGIASSLGLAKAAKELQFPVKIILIGTPAEEAGGGKLVLIERGAYDGMDACLMVHPAPLDSVGTMLAVQQINVEYSGHSAHAGAAPWEGVNAQDAGVLAYVNISALRQQIRPDHRVHGIIQGDNWAPNVIPDSCRLIYNTRAPFAKDLNVLTDRVQKCFTAAAEATGCECKMKLFGMYQDVANNANLAETFCTVAGKRFDRRVTYQPFYASTDFGNVTHTLPGLHVEYAIPLKDPKTDGNHTTGFADASKTEEAHGLTLQAAVTLATVAAKVATDGDYRRQTWDQWKRWKESVGE